MSANAELEVCDVMKVLSEKMEFEEIRFEIVMFDEENVLMTSSGPIEMPVDDWFDEEQL